jgi:hypothetical protein
MKNQIEKLALEIATKTQEVKNLQKTLNSLKMVSTLSGAYHDGVTYALAYETGRQSVELLGSPGLTTMPESLIDWGKKHTSGFVNQKLYVVGLKIESLHSVIEQEHTK